MHRSAGRGRVPRRTTKNDSSRPSRRQKTATGGRRKEERAQRGQDVL